MCNNQQNSLYVIGRCVLLMVTIMISPALAAQPLWHDTALTLQYGDNFEVDPKKQGAVVFEHASGWNFGDYYMFLEATDFHSSNQGDAFYGELSPRFSLSKLTDWNSDSEWLTDVLLATTLEFGKGNVETLLIGPGFDLKVPGFDLLQVNVYRRFPDSGRDGETIQITPVWSMSTPFAGSELIFDGFMDWNITDDGSYSENLHFSPQLKYDLGRRFGLGKRKLLVGFEYSYWKNKYGIEDSAGFDTDQSVVSLLLQAHF